MCFGKRRFSKVILRSQYFGTREFVRCNRGLLNIVAELKTGFCFCFVCFFFALGHSRFSALQAISLLFV